MLFRSDNVELMCAFPGFSAIGFLILIGPSRKSVVGKTLRRPTEERIGGTAALVAAGIAAGVDVVRVHDVDCMAQVMRIGDLIWR